MTMFAQKAVIVRRGEILLVHEGDAWGLPGGRLEAPEDLDAGLRREVLEETGVAISIIPGVIDLWSFVLLGELVVVVSRPAIINLTVHLSPTELVSMPKPDHRWGWFSRVSLEKISVIPDQMPSIRAVCHRLRERTDRGLSELDWMSHEFQ